MKLIPTLCHPLRFSNFARTFRAFLATSVKTQNAVEESTEKLEAPKPVYHASEGLTKRGFAQKFQQLFKINAVQANNLITVYEKQFNVNPIQVEENYHLLSREGVSSIKIYENLSLILRRDLDERLNTIRDAGLLIPDYLPLLQLDYGELKSVTETLRTESKTLPQGNRIVYLSIKTNISIYEVCQAVAKHSFFHHLSLKKLEQNLDILLGFGIEPKSILKDIWCLRYNSSLIRERLERVKETGMIPLKTWMIRCPLKVLDNCIHRKLRNRDVLGDNTTVEEYLSERLACDITHAESLVGKYPQLTKMNYLKMKEMIDFILQQGYTTAHILRVPRIIVHKLETTKHRFELMQKISYRPSSLVFYCKSKKDWDKYYGKVRQQAKQRKKADS